MGYHIILKIEKEPRPESNHREEESPEAITRLVHHYITDLDELRHFKDLTKESIIYQGEPSWTPALVGETKHCKLYTESNYRVGKKAEILFKEMCMKEGLIVEELNQTQESFKSYTNVAEEIPIKRGDFLIRNVGSLEVDVKCRSKLEDTGYPHYRLDVDHVDKHLNMEAFTKCPVVLAFFERNGEDPVEASLRMLSIREIEDRRADLEVRPWYDGKPAFCLPLDMMRPRFQLIDDYKQSLKQS
ncbi:MAG: hypothetical protein QNK37_05665 [Acidobacteriota bacterium]|nr:hypothetical protein [Acidobacteriota bacterium]